MPDHAFSGEVATTSSNDACAYYGFSHAIRGRLDAQGCCKPLAKACFILKYGIGTIVYDKLKAAQGIVEKVCIKKAKFLNADQVLYTDTFNWLHNEADLISREYAVALATAFFEARIQWLDQKMAVAKCHVNCLGSTKACQ